MNWKALGTMAISVIIVLVLLHNFGPAQLKAQTGTT
jgi:hypothetical protein